MKELQTNTEQPDLLTVSELRHAAAELFALFDEEVHADIEAAIKRYPDAVAVVVFENQMMDSTQCGMRTAVVVGPQNTYKTVEECEGKWLKDLPSQREYAAYYWRIPAEPEERYRW